MEKHPLKARIVLDILKKANLLLKVVMKEPETNFSGYTTDSRRVQDDSIFIVYGGVSFDPHTLLPKMLHERKSLAVIIDKPESWDEISTQAEFACLVKDSREAWAWIAAYHYGQVHDSFKIIGVTGTNGKTSTVWFVRQILRLLGEKCLTIGTLGIYLGDEILPSQHTTPDPDELFRYLAQAKEKGIEWAAMEVSSHAIVQRRFGPIRFDAVAFTSFSRDHLDFHSDMASYFAAKWSLITQFRKSGGIAWLSSALGEWKPANAAALGCRTYGQVDERGEHLDLSYVVEKMAINHTQLLLQQAQHMWRGELGFGGDFSMDNFTAAWALVKSLSGKVLDPKDWKLIAPVPGRFEPVQSGFARGLAVIVDYAHTPDALEKTLLKARELNKGRLWVVFGCGGDRDRGKRPLMGRIAEQWADHVILTSDNPRSEDPNVILHEIAAGMHDLLRTKIITDRRQGIEYSLQNAQSGDTIVIAGKGHEDYQIVGSQRLKFDDKQVAHEILQVLAAKA